MVLAQVARIAPEDFWKFSLALFKRQGEYFDIPTSTLTPVQIRESLAKLVTETIDADKATQVGDLLTLKSTPNGGVAVTDDLKYTGETTYYNPLGYPANKRDAVKYSRQNGIHVSPTVLWDGLVANEISSSWGEQEWSEFLEKKVVA